MQPATQSIERHRFFTYISPAHIIKMKTVPHQKFTKQILDAMFHESLPGIVRTWRAMNYIEVGLLNIAIPPTRRWVRKHLTGVQVRMTPEEIQAFELIAIAATSDLGTHKALIPRKAMLQHGTLILSPFHKYFTHYPLDIQVLKTLVEQRRHEKNLEFRAMLEQQRR